MLLLRAVSAFLLLFSVNNALSPGTQIQISQVGINKAVESFLQQVLVKFSSFDIPRPIRVWRLKIFDIHVIINVNPQNARIQLLNSGDILVYIQDLKVEVTGRVRYDAVIWRKTLDFRVKAKNTFLEITLGIVNENEKPRILNKKVNFDTGRPDIYVSGGPEAKIIEKTMDLFRGKIRDWLNEKVVKALNEKVPEFSNKIAQIETEKALGGHLHGLFIDYGLNANPSVTNSALIIPVATQFWASGHKNEAPVKPSGPYPFGAPWQMACVDMDTNVVYGTLAYAYNLQKGPGINKTISVELTQELKDNFLNSVIGCTCSSHLCPAKWIPAVSEFCSKKTGMIVVLSNMDRDLQVNNTGAYFSFSGLGSVDIVLEGAVKRVLDAKIEILVHLEERVIIDNWTVKGTAHVFKQKITASSPLFLVGIISEVVLENLWKSKLEARIQKWIDDLKGVGIPLPKLEFARFCNTRVGFHGPFVRFCSDVDFKFEKILPGSQQHSLSTSNTDICPKTTIPFNCRTCIARFAPLLRSNNRAIHDHFYTTQIHEQHRLIKDYGYRTEGKVGFLANTLISQCTGVLSVYRMWSHSMKNHFYTTSREEMQIARKDYRFESTIGYCMEEGGLGLTPLYQFWSPDYHDHFYTIDEDEKNMIQTRGHYRYEGILCYVWTSNRCSVEVNETIIKSPIMPPQKQAIFDVVSSSDKSVPTLLIVIAARIISTFL